MRRVSDVIKPRPMPTLNLNKGKQPVRVSKLMERRHAEAHANLARAIQRREETFSKLSKLQNRIVKLAKQVQYYEKTNFKLPIP